MRVVAGPCVQCVVWLRLATHVLYFVSVTGYYKHGNSSAIARVGQVGVCWKRPRCLPTGTPLALLLTPPPFPVSSQYCTLMYQEFYQGMIIGGVGYNHTLYEDVWMLPAGEGECSGQLGAGGPTRVALGARCARFACMCCATRYTYYQPLSAYIHRDVPFRPPTPPPPPSPCPLLLQRSTLTSSCTT